MTGRVLLLSRTWPFFLLRKAAEASSAILARPLRRHEQATNSNIAIHDIISYKKEVLITYHT
jgi:hypothetical protein